MRNEEERPGVYVGEKMSIRVDLNLLKWFGYMKRLLDAVYKDVRCEALELRDEKIK